MELNEQGAEEREKDPENLINLLAEHRSLRPANSKGKGGIPIPIELKELAALGEGSCREKAEILDIPFSSVSYAERGLKSEGVSDEGLEKIREQKEAEAKDKAMDNLALLLNRVPIMIDSATKLRDVTGAARDMAAIKKDLTGDSQNDGARVIIYAPTLVKESHYESLPIQLKE